MEKNLITVRNLKYDSILTNINMTIPNGKYITISGANKCGKTTLIKILCGLLEDNDSISQDNLIINSLSKNEYNKKVGFVLSGISDEFIFASVEQELLFILDNLGLSIAEKNKRYKNILSFFDLSKYKLSNPNDLYLFAKIKLMLAIAVIHKPEIVYLDNICTALSKSEKKEILSLIKKLNKQEKITIVFSTDNLADTLDSDYLYIMDKGTIVSEGKVMDVLKNDSFLEKLGLRLPFMVDLSLKLSYYDLLNDIETNMDEMVNILWK